jgi:hypothetical protein
MAALPHRPAVCAAALLASLVASGCGDGLGPRYPVEGQVLINGKPLQGLSGSVVFVPDPAAGNSRPTGASGELDTTGHYKLITNGKPGALAGKYKVVVTAVPPGTGDRDVVKRPAVPNRYAGEKTTPLSIEVTPEPAPGAYDLKLTRS